MYRRHARVGHVCIEPEDEGGPLVITGYSVGGERRLLQNVVYHAFQHCGQSTNWHLELYKHTHK